MSLCFAVTKTLVSVSTVRTVRTQGSSCVDKSTWIIETEPHSPVLLLNGKVHSYLFWILKANRQHSLPGPLTFVDCGCVLDFTKLIGTLMIAKVALIA